MARSKRKKRKSKNSTKRIVTKNKKTLTKRKKVKKMRGGSEETIMQKWRKAKDHETKMVVQAGIFVGKVKDWSIEEIRRRKDDDPDFPTNDATSAREYYTVLLENALEDVKAAKNATAAIETNQGFVEVPLDPYQAYAMDLDNEVKIAMEKAKEAAGGMNPPGEWTGEALKNTPGGQTAVDEMAAPEKEAAKKAAEAAKRAKEKARFIQAETSLLAELEYNAMTRKAAAEKAEAEREAAAKAVDAEKEARARKGKISLGLERMGSLVMPTGVARAEAKLAKAEKAAMEAEAKADTARQQMNEEMNTADNDVMAEREKQITEIKALKNVKNAGTPIMNIPIFAIEKYYSVYDHVHSFNRGDTLYTSYEELNRQINPTEWIKAKSNNKEAWVPKDKFILGLIANENYVAKDMGELSVSKGDIVELSVIFSNKIKEDDMLEVTNQDSVEGRVPVRIFEIYTDAHSMRRRRFTFSNPLNKTKKKKAAQREVEAGVAVVKEEEKV